MSGTRELPDLVENAELLAWVASQHTCEIDGPDATIDGQAYPHFYATHDGWAALAQQAPAMVAELTAEIRRLRKAVGEQTESVRLWSNRTATLRHKVKKWRARAEAAEEALRTTP